MLEPINCYNMRWGGGTVMQGGNWATHQTCCNDFVIKDVTITGAQLRNIRVAGYAAALLSQANVQGRG